MNTPNATAPAPDAGHRRDRRSTQMRTKLADSTLIQAALAGALSFTHIRDIALLHGQAGWKSWAYPLSVDLITVAAYRRLKRDQAGGRTTGVAWTWFIIGVAASLAANIADAVANAPVDANRANVAVNVIIGMWPAVAFFGSTLLRHSDKPAERSAAAERPAAPRPHRQPAARPAAPSAQPLTGKRSAGSGLKSTPVKPTRPAAPSAQPIAGKPQPFGDLGPRAATVGELPLPVWVQIGHPTYQLLKYVAGARPTERALQDALGDEVARLIADGVLPPAVGRPSVSTAKRVRRAIEEAHPELTAIPIQPRRLAAITA